MPAFCAAGLPNKALAAGLPRPLGQRDRHRQESPLRAALPGWPACPQQLSLVRTLVVLSHPGDNARAACHVESPGRRASIPHRTGRTTCTDAIRRPALPLGDGRVTQYKPQLEFETSPPLPASSSPHTVRRPPPHRTAHRRAEATSPTAMPVSGCQRERSGALGCGWAQAMLSG